MQHTKRKQVAISRKAMERLRSLSVSGSDKAGEEDLGDNVESLLAKRLKEQRERDDGCRDDAVCGDECSQT